MNVSARCENVSAECENVSAECENISGECENVKEKYIEIAIRDAADKLRASVERAEYKNVVLGLILLKFASVQAEVSAQGACHLNNLADGKYIITAEKAGWEPQTAVVYMNAGEMSSVTLQLTALSN